MRYSDTAKKLVTQAQTSPDHMSWMMIEDLPCSMATMQRLIYNASKSLCKLKTDRGFLVVVDFSWIPGYMTGSEKLMAEERKALPRTTGNITEFAARAK